MEEEAEAMWCLGGRLIALPLVLLMPQICSSTPTRISNSPGAVVTSLERPVPGNEQ